MRSRTKMFADAAQPSVRDFAKPSVRWDPNFGSRSIPSTGVRPTERRFYSRCCDLAEHCLENDKTATVITVRRLAAAIHEMCEDWMASRAEDR
jgi:hypothetical protein